MPKEKIISGNNRGKHIGHACEGHLRGLLQRIPRLKDCTIEKSLPFDFHVKPDAVVVNKSGKISAVFIVAFWDNARNSDMKYHRTRPEYVGLQQMTVLYPHIFTKSPAVITVLYGTELGWKPLILKEIADNCCPLIFIPQLEKSEPEKIWSQAFSEYRQHWEKGVRDPLVKVELWAKEKNLSQPEKRLLKALSDSLLIPVSCSPKIVPKTQLVSGSLPKEAYRSRYRQPLSMLSMFKDTEVSAYLQDQRPGDSADIDSFIRRAIWLDMGVLFLRTRANREVTLAFRMHEPVNEKGEYAPHLPDYSSWKSGNHNILHEVLEKHRKRTEFPGRVFKGGANDQTCGHFEDISASIEKLMPSLLMSIEKKKAHDFIDILTNEIGVSVGPWHPASKDNVILPCWSFCVCAAATIQGERKVRSSLDARAKQTPEPSVLQACFDILVSTPLGVDLLREVLDFAKVIRSRSLVDLALAVRSRPSLLSNSNACSWLSDYYNTIATNSSHNPLNNLLHDWLAIKFPRYSWSASWPSSRTTSLATIDKIYSERRQWAFIGTNGINIICAECKSVTANHWGDKSKELYDKTNDFRRFCAERGRKGLSILLFDGDLSQAALDELSTGIGHDLIITCDQAMHDLEENLNLLSKAIV